LSVSRIEALTDLGFIWETPQDRWADAVNELCEFRERHGHLDIPIDYVASGGFRLGEWAQKRRADYPAHRLPRHHVLELERLGFDWPRRPVPKRSREVVSN
jgi:hypothetical protein